ncbi:MAG TPA: hypothetical protein VGI95_09950 [Caulobacteraceae bacterium]|jgi:hypothetical protein
MTDVRALDESEIDDVNGAGADPGILAAGAGVALVALGIVATGGGLAIAAGVCLIAGAVAGKLSN